MAVVSCRERRCYETRDRNPGRVDAELQRDDRHDEHHAGGHELLRLGQPHREYHQQGGHQAVRQSVRNVASRKFGTAHSTSAAANAADMMSDTWLLL